MVDITLTLVVSLIKQEVDLERCQRHVVPQLGIGITDSERYLFETLECLVILVTLEKSESVIKQNFLSLLGRQITYIFVGIGRILPTAILIVANNFIIVSFKELDCLREVVNGHVVLLEFHMNQPQIIKVQMWMRLSLLLVNHIFRRDIILSARE